MLGAILLSDKPLYQLVIEERPVARGLLPRAAPRRLRGDARALRRGRADRRAHRDRAPAPGRASSRRPAARPAWPRSAASVPAAGQRAPLRPDRPGERAPAPPARRRPTRSRRACSGTRRAPRELVEHAERAMLEVAHDDRKQDFRRSTSILHVRARQAPQALARATPLTGTPSGFDDLDAITGGFQPGNLSSSPRARRWARAPRHQHRRERGARPRPAPVALFSLEMSEAELAQRFIACQARINGDELRKGRSPRSAGRSRRRRPAGSPRRRSTSTTLATSASSSSAPRRAGCTSRTPDGLGLIIVDYLQLMRADRRVENRVEQIGQISPRPEDPRQGAGRPGDRALPAQPRRRAARPTSGR